MMVTKTLSSSKRTLVPVLTMLMLDSKIGSGHSKTNFGPVGAGRVESAQKFGPIRASIPENAAGAEATGTTT